MNTQRELSEQGFVDSTADKIMEELRQRAAKCFGVTVVGPYMTLRFGDGKRLVCVSFQVTSITDSTILEEPDHDADK